MGGRSNHQFGPSRRQSKLEYFSQLFQANDYLDSWKDGQFLRNLLEVSKEIVLFFMHCICFLHIMNVAGLATNRSASVQVFWANDYSEGWSVRAKLARSFNGCNTTWRNCSTGVFHIAGTACFKKSVHLYCCILHHIIIMLDCLQVIFS